MLKEEPNISNELDDLIEMMKNAKPSPSDYEPHSKKMIDKSDIKYLDVSSGYKPPKDIRDKFRKD